MKKLNKLLIGLSIPTTAMAIMPLVSCGNKEKALVIDLQHDDNIVALSTDGETLTNKSFKIVVSQKDGWRQIDSSKTYIEVDGVKLTEGADKDYEIKAFDTILVHANVIKSVNVKVYVGAKATYKSMTSEWVNVSSFKMRGDTLLILPNQLVSVSNLKITVTKGDGSTFEPECGTEYGQYTIKIDNKDCTETFKAGWSFNDDIFTSKTIKSLTFSYTYNEDDGFIHTNSKWVCAGKTPTGLIIKVPAKNLKPNEKISLDYITSASGNNEYPFSDYKIVEGAETTSTDCKLVQDKDTGDWELVAGAAGTVKIEATSIIDSTVKTTATFTIDAE